MIYVGRSRIEGRGVFADGVIHPGTVIERAPLLPIPKRVEYPELANHMFSGGIALGKVSLCNHDDDPNCSYEQKDDGPDAPTVTLRAIRKLYPGDELTISYGRAWWKDRS